jgi:hypothetical protein
MSRHIYIHADVLNVGNILWTNPEVIDGLKGTSVKYER